MFRTARLPIAAILAPVFALVLAGCGPSEGPRGNAGDGRVRLSANNSYAQIGNHVVHVSAIPSVSVTPEVASTYGISRSEEEGLINVVVMQKSGEIGMDFPVRADIEVTAANLTGQMKDMSLNEVEDGPSIYYIGSVAVDDRETINFDFDIRPEDSDRLLRVRFSHQFYQP